MAGVDGARYGEGRESGRASAAGGGPCVNSGSCGGSQGNSPHWAGGDVEPQEQVQGHQTLERPAREKESQYSHGSPDNVSQEVFEEERDPGNKSRDQEVGTWEESETDEA